MRHESGTRKSFHDKLVGQVLPNFAGQLQQEGVISTYSRQRFKIPILEGLPEPEIRCDAIFILSNGMKILTEVVNPRDPKRFLGEFCYIRVVTWLFGDIDAALVLILGDRCSTVQIHRKRHMLLGRALQAIWCQTITRGRSKPLLVVGWGRNVDEMYRQLKKALSDIQVLIRIARE